MRIFYAYMAVLGSFRLDLEEFRAKTHYATQIQSLFRSHFEQRRHYEVAAAIEQMRVHRRREAEAAVAVRVQSVTRAHLERIRARIARAYFGMIHKDNINALVRPEEGLVGKECVCTCRSRWS